MKNSPRVRPWVATAIALLTLLALGGVASAEEAAAPSPLASEEIPAQCEGAADPGTPEALGSEIPEPELRFEGCTKDGTEFFVCMSNDLACGGCSSGRCAYLAIQASRDLDYRVSCYPEVTQCVSACTFTGCNELCASNPE